MRGKSSFLIWVAPFHKKIFSLLLEKNDDLSPLIWICIHNFSSFFLSSHPALCFNKNQLQEKMRTVSCDDIITIDFHMGLRGTQYLSQLKETLEKMIRETAVRLKTIKYFYKIWEYNFRANKKKWLNTDSISHINTEMPNLFILGGSSVDDFLSKNQLSTQTCIWSADTALVPLLLRQQYPSLIFSIDAGMGSFEHYTYAKSDMNQDLTFVLDPLSFPKYYTLGVKKYTYASSHPLIQQTRHSHQALVNQTGDVYGIMKALYEFLFPQKEMPKVIGHDQTSIRYATHLRGSAYHQRRYHKMNRFDSPEIYFYKLSKTY